jgi:lipopolysaccharide transport system ATP-binding protein
MGTVEVSGVGKAYRRYPSQWARLGEWILPSAGPRHEKVWVLRGIDFTVAPGEAVGLVGVNGAGKSTLLRMIAGTTRPTEGSIQVNGRASALLELGMGFHPDFTGRENAILAGQLMGLSTDEITALLPGIEAFAEIGDYIDQPLRVYSSGMQARLAFSVATALRPELLIIDEALSVGDSYFQHKSFDRIRSFRDQGTTLLFVSHDRFAVQAICDRAILLHEGRVAREGKPEEVLDFYHALLANHAAATIRQEQLEDGRVRTISGTGEVSVERVRLLNAAGEAIEAVQVGRRVTLEVTLRVLRPVPRLVLGYMIKDRLGQAIYGINTQRLRRVVTDLEAGETLTYRFDFRARLGPGSYSVALALSLDDSHLQGNLEWRDHSLLFHVVNTTRETFVGCAWLPSRLEITRVADHEEPLTLPPTPEPRETGVPIGMPRS